MRMITILPRRAPGAMPEIPGFKIRYTEKVVNVRTPGTFDLIHVDLAFSRLQADPTLRSAGARIERDKDHGWHWNVQVPERQENYRYRSVGIFDDHRQAIEAAIQAVEARLTRFDPITQAQVPISPG